MAGRLSRGPARQALLAALRIAHYAILAWGVVGWTIPAREWLIAYLVAMPLIALQWLINRNTCILNNVESWIATGRWRDAEDADQGGFIAGVLQSVTGWRPTAAQANLVSYGLLAAFWLCAALHLSLLS